ncbi:MAG: helix-turn-helix domain-containing protein, partial [Pseudomonadota bacterium]
MPKMSADEKRQSHERILKAASRLFRERGIEATSVADVMKAAGLTHGGFYRHFSSKDALVAAAFGHAVDEVLSAVEAAPT